MMLLAPPMHNQLGMPAWGTILTGVLADTQADTAPVMLVLGLSPRLGDALEVFTHVR